MVPQKSIWKKTFCKNFKYTTLINISVNTTYPLIFKPPLGRSDISITFSEILHSIAIQKNVPFI